MAARDLEQLGDELDTLWEKHDAISQRIISVEMTSVRYEGKLDQLLSSFAKLLDRSDCVAHGRDLEDVKGRVRMIECNYVTKIDLDKLQKEMHTGLEKQSQALESLKRALWGVGMLIFAAIIAIGAENVFGRHGHQPQPQNQYMGQGQ